MEQTTTTTTTIFETPVFLRGDNDRVVLLYDRFIIGNVIREKASACIRRIDNDDFNIGDYGDVVDITHVIEYEYEPGTDSYIRFGMTSADGGKRTRKIHFKDSDEAEIAEKAMEYVFMSLGFAPGQRQLTPLQAAAHPMGIAACVLFIGGILTSAAYFFHDYEPERTRIVKWYVALMYRISKVTGYMPFLIITSILIALCLVWTLGRMRKPPCKRTAARGLAV